jgi:hypothetical protein
MASVSVNDELVAAEAVSTESADLDKDGDVDDDDVELFDQAMVAE